MTRLSGSANASKSRMRRLEMLRRLKPTCAEGGQAASTVEPNSRTPRELQRRGAHCQSAETQMTAGGGSPFVFPGGGDGTHDELNISVKARKALSRTPLPHADALQHPQNGGMVALRPHNFTPRLERGLVCNGSWSCENDSGLPKAAQMVRGLPRSAVQSKFLLAPLGKCSGTDGVLRQRWGSHMRSVSDIRQLVATP
jgi:hypothetical protein